MASELTRREKATLAAMLLKYAMVKFEPDVFVQAVGGIDYSVRLGVRVTTQVAINGGDTKGLELIGVWKSVMEKLLADLEVRG